MKANALASKTKVYRLLGSAPRTFAEESILENIERAPGYAEGVSEVDPEQRGFAPGHELEDWYRSQAAIGSELPRVLDQLSSERLFSIRTCFWRRRARSCWNGLPFRITVFEFRSSPVAGELEPGVATPTRSTGPTASSACVTTTRSHPGLPHRRAQVSGGAVEREHFHHRPAR